MFREVVGGELADVPHNLTSSPAPMADPSAAYGATGPAPTGPAPTRLAPTRPAPTGDFRLPPSLCCPLESMPSSLLSSLSPPSPAVSEPSALLFASKAPSQHELWEDLDALELALLHGEDEEGGTNFASSPVKMSAKPKRRVALPKLISQPSPTEVRPHAVPAATFAPLSKRLVGGVPITKTRAPPKSKHIVESLRQIRKEQRDSTRLDRQLHPDENCSLKHRDKDRNERWARLRVLQVRRWTSLFIRGDEDEYANFGFIDELEAEKVDALCTRAAYQAAATPNSRTLETGCPALWACALVQEVWARDHHGWVVECELARDNMSFSSMENTCIKVEGWKTTLPEVHTDESVESRKTKKQREDGVPRRFSSHSFGTPDQILAKLDCLDSLLKASDRFGKGLHGDIARAVPPALMRKPKPAAAQARRLEIAANHFAKKVSSAAASSSAK